MTRSPYSGRMSEDQHQQRDDAPPLCILWSSPRVPPSERLCGALARRGIEIIRSESAAGTVAHAVRAARSHPNDAVLIVLLSEPESLSRVAESIDVIAKYAPACRCWLYREDDPAPLREVTEEDVGTFRAAAREPAGHVRTGRESERAEQPQLRLVRDESPGQQTLARHREPPERGEVESTGLVETRVDAAGDTISGLSDDELSMLLSGSVDPAEHDREDRDS